MAQITSAMAAKHLYYQMYFQALQDNAFRGLNGGRQMYDSLARACPHVGHGGVRCQAGRNSLPWSGRGARGAELGRRTREVKRLCRSGKAR